ncbi:MAG: fibronectin type III domain-containing protein [Spirochaetales bacterium]|nr:fibronectin type III domain-containing protein [Spirochaetales bacterium]
MVATVTGTSYTHTGLTSGNWYSYYLTSFNSAGESVPSSTVEKKTTGGAGTVPTPNVPAGVSADALSSSSINVSWNSVDNAASYKIYYAVGSSGASKTLAGTVYGTSYTHTSLNASTTYYYFITANNTIGESGYSSAKSATTPAVSGGGGLVAPEAPTLFVAKTDRANNRVIILLAYPTANKSEVDTYTFDLYIDGQGYFSYTNAPATQSSSGFSGQTSTTDTYNILMFDNTMDYSTVGTKVYKYKVKITKNGQSVFTDEQRVTVVNL